MNDFTDPKIGFFLLLWVTLFISNVSSQTESEVTFDTPQTTPMTTPNTTTTTTTPTTTTRAPPRFIPPTRIKKRLTSPDDKDLLVCILMERSGGDRSLVYDFDRVGAAVDVAVEYVNQNLLLDGYKVITHYQPISRVCSRKNDVVRRAMDMYNRGVECSMYLGPGCGFVADSLHNFAEYVQVPMFAIPGYGFGTPAGRANYLMGTRTSYNTRDVSRVIIAFMDSYGYKHATLITDDVISFYVLLSPVFESRITNRADLTATVRFVKIKSNLYEDEDYRGLLRESNRTSRVFVLFAKASVVRRIMINAQSLGMTNGQYVYICVDLFDSDDWGQFAWSAGDAGDRAAKEAWESLLKVTLLQPKNDYYDSFSDRVRNIARSKYNYSFQAFEEIDPLTTHFYDTIILYATIVNGIITSGGSVIDGRLVTMRTRNFTFPSLINGLVRIDDIGDRLCSYAIRSLNPETGRYELVISFNSVTGVVTRSNRVYWPTAELPPDVPYCGFNDDNPICHPPGLSGPLLIGVIVGPVIGVLLIASLVIYCIIRAVRNDGVDPNWWRISHTDVDIKQKNAGSKIGSKKDKLVPNNDGDNQSQNTRTDISTMSMLGRVAQWRGNTVSVVDVYEKRLRPHSAMIKEMNQVRVVNHQNLQRFLGVSIDENGFCSHLLGEVCQKGSLMDLLEKDTLKLDWSFKNSLIKDIVMGMAHLQSTPIESHGNLTAHTCLVDSRFLLKISDYGLTVFRDSKDLIPPEEAETERNFDILLWRAPELLRTRMPPKGTQKGDVYSFGILLQQIILRSAPFETPGDVTKVHYTAREYVFEVKKGSQPPARPMVPHSACSTELYTLMERCWDEYPIERPTFSKIKDGLKKVIGNSGDNIIDHLLKRMEQYANDLEMQVAEKTQQFQEEKRRSEELLGQLLPKSVAESLTRGQQVEPESYDSVTIYFSDIVGFTTISAAGSPMDVVSMLNNLYTMYS